ncbi:hypothetical protein PO883_14985 [Massilia sp. DJPM01]|uniref:hypothetical protein n=1 Tax=Massilia sp. DJPM01 TaxID=3024404 RepID=UPI00259FB519|nr:hypothetical protein [Massilia sp. DJPM01]MDM5178501.1 hypothetical protein [Massilia sp. DJPM01]
MTTGNEAAAQVAKIGTVWAAIGITSWAEAASFLAFLLSLAALCEWLWKKLKPVAIRRGWIADRRTQKKRKADDE